jgi:antitoxin Phd
MDWNLAEAKNRLSELVNLAITKGPQRIHRRQETVVLVAAAEFERLTGERLNFKDYLARGESFEGLNLGRDASTGREVAL